MLSKAMRPIQEGAEEGGGRGGRRGGGEGRIRCKTHAVAVICSSRVGFSLKMSRPTSPPVSSGSRVVKRKNRFFL